MPNHAAAARRAAGVIQRGRPLYPPTNPAFNFSPPAAVLIIDSGGSLHEYDETRCPPPLSLLNRPLLIVAAVVKNEGSAEKVD